MFRIISFLLSIIMCLMSFFGIDFRCQPKLEKIFDYVYDLGTYTSYDVKAADDYFADEYDDWGGKCTAVEKTLDWESSFTDVINCTEKTLFVRFFENEEKTMTLDFNKGCCWFK